MPHALGSPVQNKVLGVNKYLGQRTILLGALIVALLIAMAGSVIYQSARTSITHAIINNLQVTCSLKSGQILTWIDDMKEDIENTLQIDFATKEMRGAVEQWLESAQHDAAASQRLSALLHQISVRNHYLEVSLRSAVDGSLLMSTAQEVDLPKTQALAVASAKTGQVTLEDFHIGTTGGEQKVHIGFFCPIALRKPRPHTLVVDVTLDASEVLFPIIQQWPGWGPTTVTLLLRKEGENVLVLNRLLRSPDAALSTRFATSALNTIPVKALKSGTGVLYGMGSLNTPAIAYTLPISNTPWTLVAEVDEESAYAKLNTIATLSAAIIILLMISIAWWLAQHWRNSMIHMSHAMERQLLTTRINYLAKYANDCIMLCDAIGHITDVNDRCHAVYGYTQEEFLGMDLNDLRTPSTRLEVPKLLARIEGGDGLIYEAEHASKSGTLIPVEISASLVHIEGISFYQAIIRDLTMRKKLEEERVEHLLRVSELSRRLVTVQETERRDLSAVLHDRIGANLATINIDLRNIANALPTDAPPRARILLSDTGALLSETIASIREFCADLRPALLDYAGLVPALKELVSQFGKRTGLSAHLNVVNLKARLPGEMESLLYRIVQEALLNCVKHAEASTVQIDVSQQDNKVSISVEDDGVGFDPRQVGLTVGTPGLGLLTMRERAELAGGQLFINSSPQQGTTILVEIELDDAVTQATLA